MQRQINQGKVHSHIYVVSAICTVSVEKKKRKKKDKKNKHIFFYYRNYCERYFLNSKFLLDKKMHKKKSTIGQKDGQKLKRQNAVQIAARAILRGESVFYNA